MAYLYDLTDTWNAAGTVFNAIKMNVTNSASAAGSKIVSLQVGSTDRFTVDKDGNGYFSGTLQAVGAISFPNAYLSGNSGTIGMQDNTASILAYNGTGSGGITNTLRFITGASERMRIGTNGFLGVGTTSPTSRINTVGHNEFSLGFTAQTSSTQTALANLPVVALANTDATVGNGAGLRYQIADTSGTLRTAGNIGLISTAKTASTVTADMYFTTGATERMRLDSSGNLGIGTSSPGAKLNVVDNSASDALRITQTGAGNALVVEDSTTPDSSPFLINASGLAVTGSTTALTTQTGTARIQSTAISAFAGVVQGATATNAATIDLSRCRGTFDAPTIVSSGDSTGRISFGGHDGVAYIEAAKIEAAVDGTPGINDMPGRLVFSTTADGAASPTERMRIASSGNVGIGTSSPSQKLTVQGAQLTIPAAGWSSGQVAYNYLGDTNGGIRATNGGNVGVFAYNGFDVTVNGVTPVTAMTITSGANVGIGTAAPGSKLTVVGGAVQQYKPSGDNNAFYGSTSDNSNNYLRLGNTTGTLDLTCSNGSAYLNTTQNGPLWFGTNGTERVRITSSGDVGIGTSSPNNKLDVNGNVNIGAALLTGTGVSTADAQIELGGNRTGNGNAYIDWHTTSGADYEMRIARYTGVNGGADILNTGTGNFSIGQQGAAPLLFLTNNTERARIDSSGNLLVGTSSTFDNVSYLKLQSLGGVSTKIAGTSLTSQMSFFNDNGRVGYIGTDGTTTSYNTSSDARLKHDIVDAPEASSLIDAIKVRSFKWNADNSEQRYGMVAQELLEVAPEAVSVPADEDEMMGVDYSKLVPMLIKEIQSLRARVAQLEGN